MRYLGYTHVHVSEREGGHRWSDGRWDDAIWEDCLWSAGLEVLRFAGLSAPATHAEMEALRAASGEPPTGGSNHGDLARGTLRRYGVSLPVGSGFAALTVLPVGSAAAVNGSWKAFAPTHRLRRHDDFEGSHTIAVFKLDGSQRFWLCDPLAPAVYDGEWATWDEVRLFMAGFDGRFSHARYKLLEEAVATITITVLPWRGTLTIPAGSSPSGLKIDPATGTITARKVWPASPSPSTATYDAVVDLSALGIRGAPFVRVTAGFFAGFYVGNAGVIQTPNQPPADDTPHTALEVRQAFEEGKVAGLTEGVELGRREAASGVKEAAVTKAAEYGA